MNQSIKIPESPHLYHSNSCFPSELHLVSNNHLLRRVELLQGFSSPHFLYGNSRLGLHGCSLSDTGAIPNIQPLLNGSRYFSASLTTPIISLLIFDITPNPLLGVISQLLFCLLWIWLIYEAFIKGGKKHHAKKK